jgi:hypothetical protein
MNTIAVIPDITATTMIVVKGDDKLFYTLHDCFPSHSEIAAQTNLNYRNCLSFARIEI